MIHDGRRPFAFAVVMKSASNTSPIRIAVSWAVVATAGAESASSGSTRWLSRP